MLNDKQITMLQRTAERHNCAVTIHDDGTATFYHTSGDITLVFDGKGFKFLDGRDAEKALKESAALITGVQTSMLLDAKLTQPLQRWLAGQQEKQRKNPRTK